MGMGKINSFRDLKVYKRLFRIHLEIHQISLTFPAFEMYELGSQIRRSSNSSPAQIVEGWNNKHTNIYLESLNRAIGEIQETQHHLSIANAKGYIDKKKHRHIDEYYTECIKMIYGLRNSLRKSKN